MHKSKGNAIWFEDAAEQMGADVMRWMLPARQPRPTTSTSAGHGGDELKRGFLSTLWNTYSFFVTYANIDGWTPPGDDPAHAEALKDAAPRPAGRVGRGARSLLTELDRWALSELNQLVATCTHALENYDSMTACRQIEEFVEGLSNWYVRRSRRRFWKARERTPTSTLPTRRSGPASSTVNRLMAPLVPFLAEEMYQNLVRSGPAGRARERPPLRLARRLTSR